VIDIDGMRHAAEEDESAGNHLQADYLRRGADEIEKLRTGAGLGCSFEPFAEGIVAAGVTALVFTAFVLLYRLLR
jgi:hypothetical protein